jgi:hypothetical protein
MSAINGPSEKKDYGWAGNMVQQVTRALFDTVAEQGPRAVVQFFKKLVTGRVDPKTMSSWTITILEKFKTKIEGNQEHSDVKYPHITEQLNIFIDEVKKTEDSSALSNTQTKIQSFVNDFVPIGVLGIPITSGSMPGTGAAIVKLMQNIADHDAALENNNRNAPLLITQKDIKDVQEKLTYRTAAFFPMQIVIERLCGFNVEPSFYVPLLDQPASQDLNKSSELFRARLFNKIDESNLFILRKWIAKAFYTILTPVSLFITRGMIDRIIRYYQDWMAGNSRKNPRDVNLIQAFRNWLETLSNAFSEAANTPYEQAQSLSAMIEKALKSPQRNHHLKQREIYHEFSKLLFKLFGPRIECGPSIEESFKNIESQLIDYPFLNAVIKPLGNVIIYALKAIIFIPEYIANQILQLSGKLFLRYNNFLQQEVEGALRSVPKNTPFAFALNQAFYKQLTIINEKIDIALSLDKNGSSSLHYPLHKKEEIVKLLNHLYEVLAKGKYYIQSDLKNYCNKQLPPIEALVQYGLNFGFSLTSPKLAQAIGLMTDIILSDEGLNRVLYEGLWIANGIFDTQPEVSDTEFASLDKAIEDLSDTILERIMSYALDSDSSQEQQRNIVHKFYKELKTTTENFIQQIRNACKTTQNTLTSSPHYTKTLQEQIKLSEDYQNAMINMLRVAEGNSQLSGIPKKKFNKVLCELAANCEKLGAVFNKSVSVQKAINLLGQSTIFNNQCRGVFSMFEQLLCTSHIDGDQIKKAHIQQSALEDILASYEKLPLPKTTLNLIRHHQAQINAAIDQIEKTQANYLIILNHIAPTFEKLKEEKLKIRRELGEQFDLNEEFDALSHTGRELISKLHSLSQPLHDQAIHQVLVLMEARSPEAILQAEIEFNKLISATHSSSAQAFTHAQNQIQTARKAIDQIVQEDNRRASETTVTSRQNLAAFVEEALEHVNSLETWNNELKEFAVCNFDFGVAQIAADKGKEFALWWAKGEVQQLRKTFFEPSIGASGFAQLVMIPLLEKHGVLKPASAVE